MPMNFPSVSRLIMSKKERKTHKGTGFHLDLLLICFMELGCAFVGGPWLCAATVRCVSHLCALTVMSSRVAPGETPQVYPSNLYNDNDNNNMAILHLNLNRIIT